MDAAFIILFIAFLALCAGTWKLSQDLDDLHEELHDAFDFLSKRLRLEEYLESDDFKVKIARTFNVPVENIKVTRSKEEPTAKKKPTAKKTNKKGTK